MAIRIRKRIDSETLHLPELRHLIGKAVDITVEEESPAAEQPAPRPDNEFWNPPSLEEIARRQGIDPDRPTPPPRHYFTEEEFDGFDEWLSRRRKDLPAEDD